MTPWNWYPSDGGWRVRDVPAVSARVGDEGTGWSWWLQVGARAEGSKRLYLTAAGARAACERVARRLGVVC